MSKITISVDSTADLTPDLYKKYNLEVIDIGVVVGSQVYNDRDVTPNIIYKAVEKDGILPKTNAALEVDYRDLFEKATQDGGSVIHFNMSSKLSVSHENARRASQGLERVHVIDTKSACSGTGILAIKASVMVKDGKSVEEILSVIKPMVNKLNLSLIIKDLKYLYRGGRASGLKLLGANFLKIRPSMTVKDGSIVPDKKYRGHYDKAVIEWTKYRISQAINADKSLAFVCHSDIDDAIPQGVINSLKEAGFKDVQRVVVGAALTIHLGRNALGIIFLEE